MKSMKKIMYVLSVAMLIAMLLAVAVMAETATGKFGVFGATDGSESALTWTFAPEKFTVDGVEYDANTLVISGTGTTWTYESGTVGYMNGGWNVSGFPWTAYHASVEKIVITAPITKIPAKAFARHFKLTTVLFPETYKEFDTSEPFNEIKTLTTIGVTGKDVVEGVWDFRNFTYINNETSLLYSATPSPVIFLPANATYKSVETNDTGNAGMLALYYKYALNAKFFVTAGSDGEKIANNTKKNASGWYTSSSFNVTVTTGYDYDPTKVEESGPVIPSGGGTSGDTTTSGFSPYWPVAEDGKSGTFGIYTATDETKNALKWTYDTVKFTVDDVEYDPYTLVITGAGTKWSYPDKSVSYVSGGWTYKGLPWYHLRNDIKKVVIATESVTSFPGSAFAGMTKMDTFLFPQNYTEFRAVSMFNGSNKLTTLGYNGTEYVRGVIDLRKMTYIDNSCAISWFANSSEIVWLPETCTYKTTEVGETGSAGIFVLYDNNSTAITFACVAGTDGEKIAKQTQENKNGYHKNKNFAVTIVYEYIAPEILDTPEDITDTFDYSIYENATASGHLFAGTYCNANWYYFEDTKTLMYLAATTGYTETGTIAAAEDKIGWADYKNDIEHIVIGPGISKITGGAFADMSAVKDIRLGSNITRCSSGTFKGCTSLTTIWRANGERVEGRADLTSMTEFTAGLESTLIEEVVYNKISSITISFSPSIKTIYHYNVNDEIDAYCQKNYIDLVDAGRGFTLVGDYGIDIDPSLPRCGARVTYEFDEATGTLTLGGAGMTSDITNYYGGGSKNQWWFEFKMDIKHVIVGDLVSGIGKYAFCECENLETVELPASDNFEILNAAFEGCTNLKAIYRRGETMIEGTADLRGVKKLQPWTFAYDYLIANVIVDDNLESVGSTTFEENVNLMAIYGAENSVGEEYAKTNNLQFYNSATATPSPITCTIPVKEEETTTEAIVETEPVTTEPVTTEPVTTEPVETEPVNTEPSEGLSGGAIAAIVIGGCVLVAVIAVVVIMIIKKKKTAKN